MKAISTDNKIGIGCLVLAGIFSGLDNGAGYLLSGLFLGIAFSIYISN